jgi:2-oxoglutarate dehydrogenase E1 component
VSADDFGANEWLVEEMFEQYQRDPQSVGPEWVRYFKANGTSAGGNGARTPSGGEQPAKPQPRQQAAPQQPAEPEQAEKKQPADEKKKPAGDEAEPEQQPEKKAAPGKQPEQEQQAESGGAEKPVAKDPKPQPRPEAT